MPKEKKDLDKTKEKTKKTSTKTNKSKVVKKTTKTTTAKKASAKVSKPSIVKSPKKEEKTKKELKPKKEEITIDIISDNEEVLSEARDLVLPKKSREEISEKDLQKKYFSQLVDEMKGRGPNLNQEEYFNKSSAGPSLALYRRLFWRFSAGILIFLVLLFYLFFTKLTIIIHPKSELINDSLSFNLLSNEQGGDELSLQAERNLIGKLEKINLSVDKLYNASGENPVSEEVSGELTIYNNYSQSQTLIASTRLLSSSSKLFRLSETVNVPAGSSIKASVYADIASPEMAISADSFTIPGLWLGLQDKIYAESYEPFV